MSTVKTMKQNDLLSTLDVTFKYRDPALALNIVPGTTVVFTMTPVGSTTPKINRQPATVISSTGGEVVVRYTWVGTDTDTVGDYNGEFEFTIGGKAFTGPTNGYITVRVEDDLA